MPFLGCLKQTHKLLLNYYHNTRNIMDMIKITFPLSTRAPFFQVPWYFSFQSECGREREREREERMEGGKKGRRQGGRGGEGKRGRVGVTEI